MRANPTIPQIQKKTAKYSLTESGMKFGSVAPAVPSANRNVDSATRAACPLLDKPFIHVSMRSINLSVEWVGKEERRKRKREQ